MASVVCHDEYFTMNAALFSKKSEAIKYPTNPMVLPAKVSKHKAVNSVGRFFVFVIFFNFFVFILFKKVLRNLSRPGSGGKILNFPDLF